MDIEYLHRRIRLVTRIFRGFLLLLLVVFVLLILQKQVMFLKCVVFFASFIFATVFVYLIKMQKILPKAKEESNFEKMLANVNEAQKIINTKKHIYSRNFSATNQPLNVGLFTFDGFLDFIQSHIVWITCLGINGLLIFHPVYFEIIGMPQLAPALIAKILALSVLQFLFVGLCISGIYLSVSKFIKGSQK